MGIERLSSDKRARTHMHARTQTTYQTHSMVGVVSHYLMTENVISCILYFDPAFRNFHRRKVIQTLCKQHKNVTVLWIPALNTLM